MSDLAKTDVVILCGGQGTRLREKIGDNQKVLAEVDGQPFIDIILKYLEKQGFRRVVLCVGFHADAVENFCKKGNYNLDLVFSKEEKPLGTGGALQNAQPHILSSIFFVLNGDSFCPVDYQDMLDTYREKTPSMSLAISEVAEVSDYGLIAVDDDSFIASFEEKTNSSSPRYVNAGVYCVNKGVFYLMPKDLDCFSLEKDFFPQHLDKRVYGYAVEAGFVDIGTPDRFQKAKELLDKVKS